MDKKNINFSNSAQMNQTDERFSLAIITAYACKLVKARQAFWSHLKLLHTRKPGYQPH